jgi:hypothetical protein
MFSQSQTYRLAVTVTDADGTRHLVNPTELARFTSPDTAAYLSGSEHFRHAPAGLTFREHLPALGGLACGVVPRAALVSIELEIRRTLDSPIERSGANVRCDPT